MNTIPAHKLEERTNKISISLVLYLSTILQSMPYQFSRSRTANGVYTHVTLSFAFPIPKHSQGNHHKIHTDDKTEFQQYLRKVHLQNGHITDHNLTQIGKFNQPSIMTFTKSDKEKIYIESMTYLKNNDFGFEGSGTESSRRLIPIFQKTLLRYLKKQITSKQHKLQKKKDNRKMGYIFNIQ